MGDVGGSAVDPQVRLLHLADGPVSRKERNAIERSYLKALDKYITEEDIYKVSKKMRCSDSHVRNVLNGFHRDNDVMRVLQARALANKNQWEDAYSPAKMDEVLSQLL